MFARITVQSGIAAGTTHRIRNRVARIGSDPQSDVCLPTAEVADHALTLEFREDGCRVYNRGRESICIGALVVEPEQVAEWAETDVLQLGHSNELLLDFDDSEVVDIYPDDWDGADVDDQEKTELAAEVPLPEPSSSGTTLKTVLQLSITVACLVGCAFLLIRHQNRQAGPDAGPGFAEIVTSSLADPQVPSELVRRLQYAEAQRIRGREDAAEDEYQALRDDLLASMNGAANSPKTDLQAQVLRLIQSRLAELND